MGPKRSAWVFSLCWVSNPVRPVSTHSQPHIRHTFILIHTLQTYVLPFFSRLTVTSSAVNSGVINADHGNVFVGDTTIIHNHPVVPPESSAMSGKRNDTSARRVRMRIFCVLVGR